MYVAFPGFEATFKSQLVLNQSWQVDIGEDLAHALLRHGRDRFEEVLNVYSRATGELTKKHRIDVVICCLPPEVIESCSTVPEASLRENEPR